MIPRRLSWPGPMVAIAAASSAAAQSSARCTGGDYGPRAECGTLSVYENRGAGTGRRLDIRYVVLRAEKPSGREPLFLFAGGPGQGSTELAPLANGAFGPIRRTRDIVLVDQRGTGGSNP